MSADPMQSGQGHFRWFEIGPDAWEIGRRIDGMVHRSDITRKGRKTQTRRMSGMAMRRLLRALPPLDQIDNDDVRRLSRYGWSEDGSADAMLISAADEERLIELVERVYAFDRPREHKDMVLQRNAAPRLKEDSVVFGDDEKEGSESRRAMVRWMSLCGVEAVRLHALSLMVDIIGEDFAIRRKEWQLLMTIIIWTVLLSCLAKAEASVGTQVRWDSADYALVLVSDLLLRSQLHDQAQSNENLIALRMLVERVIDALVVSESRFLKGEAT